MKVPYRLDAAISRYKADGVIELSTHILRFAYRNAARQVVASRVGPHYHGTVVDSAGLKSRAGDRVWELDDDIRKLSKNYQECLVPSQDSSDQIHNKPVFLFNQSFVAEVKNITVVGPRPIALTEDGQVIADTIYYDPYCKAFENGKVESAIESTIDASPARVAGAILGGRPIPTRTSLSAATILEYRWDNYYHWILEELPKLRGVERYEAATGEDVTLILRTDPPPYLRGFLDRLGFDKWVEFDAAPIHVDRFVAPSFPELTPGAIGWLRDAMLKSVSPPVESGAGPDWLYVSRQGVEQRRVANFEQVKDILDEYGIKIITPESISLREEVRLFNTAKGIIGPHGAGLTAMLWGNDLTVLELFNETINSPFYLLADLLGYDYYTFSGESVGKQNSKDRNIRVDVTQFEKVVSSLTTSDSNE